jgi:hypothetical protein
MFKFKLTWKLKRKQAFLIKNKKAGEYFANILALFNKSRKNPITEWKMIRTVYPINEFGIKYLVWHIS